ncbi:hypothetical protein JK364_51205 [Streptomyces sp. 110]|uniref:Uncharacterized protein n=1 Tax=Streptomyces endocoffeicus TaxID=2898945 RepID=A0ABS1Q7G1_9ACTN|nr:hypothetical protein [Streptomyces endocoffeicus]MBL1120601.1 hypothetical protein [Streptomyces endocoffeicus]
MGIRQSSTRLRLSPQSLAHRPGHRTRPETIGDIITALGAPAALLRRLTSHSTRHGGAASAKRTGADRKAIAAQSG